VKFSRKLLGKRVRKHINIKSVTLNVQSVHKPYTCWFAVAYESSGQPLPQVSQEGHSRSSSVLFEASQLLMAYLSNSELSMGWIDPRIRLGWVGLGW